MAQRHCNAYGRTGVDPMQTGSAARPTSRRGAGRLGRALAAAFLASVAGVGAGAPSAWAGYVPLESCSSLAGTVQFQPGLAKTAHAETATLSSAIAGCSHLGGNLVAGGGTLTAQLSGQASLSTTTLRGAFTIDWPASSGLSPSEGVVGLSGPSKGVFTLSGEINSGAFTEGVIHTTYKVTEMHADRGAGSPVTTEMFVGSSPLQALFNLG
jgi:hypothetical protein